MEGSTIVRSLTILTRSSQTKELESSQERRPSLLSLEDSNSSELANPPPSTRDELTLRRSPTGPSLPSTPPPDEEFTNQFHLFNGVGELFPLALPSRATSLTLGSECTSNVSVVTSDRRSTTWNTDEDDAEDDAEEDDADDEDLLETPKAEEIHLFPALETPARPVLIKDCIVVQMPPLTPDPSPRCLKRGSSPPSTPRQEKRPRLAIRDAPSSGNSISSREVRLRPSFQEARQRTTELAGASFLAQRWQWLNDAEMSPLEFGEAAMVKNNGITRRAQSLPPLGSSDLEESLTLSNTTLSTEGDEDPDQRPVQIQIEWFGEEEIEAQLSGLLASYRGFYLDSEASSNETIRYDAESARAARLTFKAIFENRLNSAEDEGFLLQEEEEDVMNMFMTWVREVRVPDYARVESFPNFEAGLDRMNQLAAPIGSQDVDVARPFVRRIVLFPNVGREDVIEETLEIRGLGAPVRGTEGELIWQFNRISCDLERSEAAELLNDWDGRA